MSTLFKVNLRQVIEKSKATGKTILGLPIEWRDIKTDTIRVGKAEKNLDDNGVIKAKIVTE